MERRRAAAALLALAACFACSAAAPTASNPTALELHDGPSEGCYYNFQHYGEGDRIMTNEPCLNCTCHNRMLMCYLRVCPFTKAIGQDCTVEKRADQCCPIVTCPDVPVDLLTSTSTSSPAEYGPTGVGKLDKYGCSINNKYFPEGSKVPSSPNKPCEHCYCIRNMTTCVMQECTLHVDGCTPIYHKDVCCPVRYSCDHLEDEIPLLDDMTTTVRPTQGFLLTTTTMIPVTQITQDCIHDEQIFPDGASIKTDKACEHCYCMKGDIVCVVQECGTPMENEGKNCTSLPPRQGQCCPDTYICEGDEPSLDLTTETIDLTSAPPRRLGVEGSGYRNEPDEPYTDRAPLEHEIEGSGDLSETDIPTKIASTIRDELLIITTEKEVPYSQTTEADKDLNITTDKISEKEPSVTFEEDSFRRPTESVLMTSTESKATVADEIISTDGVTSKHDEDDIHTKAPFHSYEGDEMLPTDSAIEKETSLNVPDQSTLMDEHSVTEATTSTKKELEITLGSAEIVTPKDITTTERSVVINVTENESSNDETSEINKIDIMSEMTIADISVTEQNKPDFGYTTIKELNIVDDVTTVSSKKDTTESTSINPVDNEVDYIPGRIPGEGDCLLNGITYNNNTSVPSTNNCHSGCKCISSIVKCDPIICSPPPEYMENMNDCQTSYDTPDACCPTYVCSAKETSLPQSHSQTSVTESSKPVAGVECNGNECSSDEVKQQSSEPNKICDSGNCESESTQNECGINGCQGEEQTPLERPSNCSGGKCSVAPTVICDSENCETAPTEEKDVDDKIHSESQGKPICNDADGCDNVKDTSPKQDECKDESCRRKDTFETETNIQAECSGTQCKIDNEQKIPHIEPTIAPVTEYIINQENTEIDLGELDTQKTAPPVLNIITPEKTVVTESTINIDIEPATVKVQLPDETLNDVINTEEPVKLITESAISITDNTVTKTEEDITKSETSSSELTPMSDSATEKTKTSEEISTEQGSYTSAPGLDKTEAFTESKLVDYTSENKDTSSDTKEVSQKTTEKSETLSDIYETEPDESFTKLPIVKDTEKEIYTMETPKLPENEVKVTGSEDYPMATDKIDAISVSDEKLGITKQPTVIQENVQTELPESAMEIESDNRDHSDLVPTEMQDLTTEIVENDKIEDYNKFTTIKSITLSGDNENQTPMKTETQSIISGTVSSESTTPEIILADIHKTYTELPQSLGTKSDINESDIKFEEPTTISSDVKQPEEFSTKLDEAMPEDGHSETETENPDYATTEGKPSILNDDKLNVDLNLDVTEKQTTTSQIKHTDEKEIEEELQTKLPKVDEITKGTELEMTTESYKETEMKDFEDRDLQTISPLDSKITVSDSPYTSNEGLQPSSELTPKDQYLVLQTSTTPQDISLTKDTTTAAVLRDENDIEITSSTDKNELKITSSSDESVMEIISGQELMTELPRETIEHHPTKDFKLTTLYSENTVIPIETTTTFVISEEKQQTPDLGVPEEAKETIKDITTANPLLTKEIIGEDIPSSKLPDIISQSEDTSAIPSDEEKMTTSSNDNIKEEEKTEINLEEIAQTTTSNIHISESITEKIDIQPQDHPTHDSSADESSEKSDVTEKYLITESPYSQTSSIDSNISNIAPEEYEVDQNAKLPASAINDDNKPISTSIPLLTQDNEIIITEKIPTPGLSEEEATTEKSEYDLVPGKNKQPSEAMPSESNTDHDIFQNSVTEETKTTKVSPYESELQNSGITGSVQEDEKSSPEVTKQTTETPLESELTIQEEHQTIASETSSSISDTEIEDVRTTESVPIKQEDLPIYPDMPVESIHTISDESYTTATTEVVPRRHEELPIQPEIAPIPTVLPNLDTTKGDEGVSKIESATLPTESSETGKPSLITSTEVSKTDTTKLIDVFEEQQLSSKVPEPSIETTSRTETEGVTESEGTEPYTTEKQYISISDQEEVPKVPELPAEHAQIDTETENKEEDFGTATTEKQYVTKSDQEDIPKIPVLIDEQSTSQGDIESVTELDHTEHVTTVDQYVTKANERVPEIPKLPEEQNIDQTYPDVVSEKEDSEPFTTEKTYVTKLDQESPKFPEQSVEQSTSRIDTESIIKLDDTQPSVTEKHSLTDSPQDEVPKIPEEVEEQSTSRIDTESITKLEETQPSVTEKHHVTDSQDEVPKVTELIEEQSTSRVDTDSVTKLEDTQPSVTEKQHVTDSPQDEVPKVPEQIEEQSTSRIDTESITNLEDTQPSVTEKQYVTDSPQDEVPKVPEQFEEQSTSRIDTESITKLEDTQPSVTEKQHVTDSPQDEVPKVTEPIEEQSTSRIDTESITKLEDTQPSVTEKQHVTDSPQDEVPKVPEQIEEQSTSRIDTESITKLEETQPSVTEKQHLTDSPQDEVPKVPEQFEEQSTSRIDTESITKLEETQPSVTEKQYVTDSPQNEVPKIPVVIDEQSTSQSGTEDITELIDIEAYTTEKQYVTKSDEDVSKIQEPSEEQSTTRTDIENEMKQEDSKSSTTEKPFVTKTDQEDIQNILVSVDEQSTSQSDIESVTKLDDTEFLVTEKQYSMTNSDQEEVHKIPVVIDEESTSKGDRETINDIEPYTTEKQYVTKSDEDVSKIQEPSEEQSTTRTDIENEMKQEDSKSSTTEKPFVTKTDQEDIQNILVSVDEQSTSQSDIESVTKLDDTEFFVTEKQYSMTNSDQEEVHKIPVVIDEESTSKGDRETINDIEPYTTEKQYVTKSDEDVSKIQEPSEEQSTTRTDIENEMKQEDSKSSTTEKPFVTKTDQEDIQNILVSVDEQSTSQSDIESVTKLDDTEFFVTEKQYSMTNSDQEEVHKIPVVIDEESTSKGDRETINDIEPYTTEKQYVTKLGEEVQELPKEPTEEQSTDRIYTEVVSKSEDSGLFTTERQFVTKLEQEVPKIPEQNEDQSTSRYDSESVTKLEDIEPFVTEKQYVSSSGEEETSKFPVQSEEQSTSRIDTESVTTMEDSGTDHEIPSSHKLDTDVSKPDLDNKNIETITPEPSNYPDTTIKSELEGSDLIKPSEDVTVVPQKEVSTELNPTDISIPEKVETPTKTVTENLDDFEKYSTERNVQTSGPAGETVILEEVTDAKPYETEHKTPSKSSTDEEGTFSETTPYSVLLEEHTHLVLEETSSSIPIEEGTTLRNEVLPERGDQIPDTPEINDEYEHTTAKQVEVDKTTVYEKISSPVVQSDATEPTTIIEKITSDSSSQGEDNKYSPSTPVVLPTIKEKEEHTTPPTTLEKEITTLGGIIAGSEEPEITSSSSKGDSTQELLPSSTSKLQEESTTHLPSSEDKYKEKPFTSAPSPSSSELPEILEEPHEEEHSPDFPPSGAGAGYGQEPDYVEEDQAFGPGTCRYGGKVYVSAQQIPRDDPCDFCFCFRSDIICLQQSCPPPIHGCHEEPIQGFCCPRYECPVSMATTVNVTTTTTTTTTTLPPHFLPHAYKGAAQRRGCQIKGHSYKVGEVVRASSGPCLHCTCGGDGQMKCDPKACTPEPMLRQMIAAAVSAKRRR